VVTIATVLEQVAFCATAAYGFARLRFAGAKAIFVLFLATMMIPFQVTMIPLATLAGGVGPDGRDLAGNGWMALRRLGWGAVAPPGVAVSDRVRRIAEEEAARALRLACHRRGVIAALAATWPKDPFARTDDEWKALRAVLPAGVDNATIRPISRRASGLRHIP
jgi:hypothetical protein